VNKKVLKVPGIEQKVQDSAPATLSHTTISWAISFVCSYFPLPVVGKKNDVHCSNLSTDS
jgi:hypothetical protein